MRTPKLLIVAIRGARGTDEVTKGAIGIYTKYSQRVDINREVQLIFISRSGKLQQENTQGSLDIQANDVLGIYIVGQSYDLETATDTDQDHNLIKSIKEKILDVKSNGNPYVLDKISLVVCNTAKDATEALNDSEDGILIARFARQLAGQGLKPRLAGWTKYVTADETGRKKILSSSTLQQGYASNMSKSRADQKMVYIWDNDRGYVRKTLADWTEKA